MQLFRCQSCEQLLYFEKMTHCERSASHRLGYLPLDPRPSPLWTRKMITIGGRLPSSKTPLSRIYAKTPVTGSATG